MSVNVLATEELSSITFQIMGRSDVILSKTLAVAGSKSVDFTFMPTVAMMPKAELVVYYMRPDGEIISDHLKIKFGFQLQNFVSELFKIIQKFFRCCELPSRSLVIYKFMDGALLSICCSVLNNFTKFSAIISERCEVGIFNIKTCPLFTFS